MNDKVCVDCGQTKNLGLFGNLTSSPDGKQRYCLECGKTRREARKGSTTKASPTFTAKSALALAHDEFIQPREVVATFAAIQMMAQDGELAPNMIFRGPSGCGKTESARDLAKRAGLPYFQVDAPSNVDPDSWFGVRDVVDGDKGPVTRYTPSVFITAIQQPCLLNIDEFNRVSDDARQIMLSLWDGSRQVTNPLTGQIVKRHPLCFIVATCNVGLAFTGTKAIDPAFYTRAYTTNFAFLEADEETALIIGRTGLEADDAATLVRFATETRQRAANDEDFPPVSTRELLEAARVARRGLDLTTSVRQAIINAASDEGGAESVRASLEYTWKGIVAPTA